MTNQDNAKWQELLGNEYFNQDEFLAEYAAVKKHPSYSSHYGDCPYCKCSGTFTAKQVDNELLVQCTGMHQRKKTPCMMCGNLCDMLILLDNCSMEEALAKIEAWVFVHTPNHPGAIELEPYQEQILRDVDKANEILAGQKPIDIEEMAAQEPKGDWVQNLLPKGKKRGRKGKNNG